MKIKFDLKATVLRPITGKLKTSVSLVRTIAGLRLPVSCLLINGVNVGSCNYDDLCKFVQNLSYNPELKFVFTSLFETFFDLDETNTPICPIKTEIQKTEFSNIIDIPDFSKTPLSLFMSGDYNMTVSIREENSDRNVGCWSFVYTMIK